MLITANSNTPFSSYKSYPGLSFSLRLCFNILQSCPLTRAIREKRKELIIIYMARTYGVIVVGGGHAGAEAAAVSARMGVSTLLVTTSIHHIALMPCNPAIGGPGKGHVVREIDALGGLMGRVADLSAIHVKKVNTGKGPAVQTLRVQTDRELYSRLIREELEALEHLDIYQGEVESFLVHNGRIQGVRTTSGVSFHTSCAVLAAGTFLNGEIKIGELSYPAGRQGEFSSIRLARTLQGMGLPLMRLNTCTPPRLDRATIDTSHLERQESDTEPLCFSFAHSGRVCRGPVVYITRTTAETCALIRKNFHRSPLLQRLSDSSPVRECPSLEDKVYRFPQRENHLVFLEPEGEYFREVYAQGIFTSLPEEIQWAIVRSIPGLEKANIIRPGYGIEYDIISPTILTHTLECRAITGLYCAGQINGTSGYEEAGGQGILAGINAALASKGEPPFLPGRDESYIAVMVDDLVTRGVCEPYRLRTGKVEHRLVVRHGNADMRLTARGYAVGAVNTDRYQHTEKKRKAVQKEIERLSSTFVSPSQLLGVLLRTAGGEPIKTPEHLARLLSRPRVTYRDLAPFDPTRPYLSPDIIEEVETEITYAGYIERQKRAIQSMHRLENKRIPEGFDYSSVKGLSAEARERLAEVQPLTLGQASRVRGVTPADMAVLSVLIELPNKKR